MPDCVKPTGIFCGLLLLCYSSRGQSMPQALPVEVKASIVNGCVISGTNPGVLGTLDFGTLPGINTTVTTVSAAFVQNAALTLACTPGTALKMNINGGDHYGNNSRNLKITTNNNLLAYTLYSDATHTTAIPINGDITLTYNNANNITLPVYGQLQVNQFNRAGTYTDTLTVTLSW